MRTSLFCALALALLAPAGCDDGTDGDADVDVDADTDGDADGDADDVVSVAFQDEEMHRTGYSGGPTLLLAEVSASEETVVDLSVTTVPDSACEVAPQEVTGSGVLEVLLRPDATHEGETITITLRAESPSDVATGQAEVEVIDWADSEGEHADSLLADFLAYLEEHHAEMGLDPETAWTESFPTYPSILVVSHRTYLATEWDLHLAWHNTIAPYDWAYVLARRRTELEPSLGLCFPSQSGDRTVQPSTSLSDPRLPCAAD